MGDLVLANLENLENQATAVAAINSNNDAIETAFDDVLTKSGPNVLSSDIDMNGHRITNLPAPTHSTDPIRKAEYDTLAQLEVDAASVAASKDDAVAAASAAASSASSASTSATNASNSAAAAAASAAQASEAVSAGITWTTLPGKPTFATVATSGLYSDLLEPPTLGTAASKDTGTGAGQVVVLDGSAKLPAIDGSQLTGIASPIPSGVIMPYAGASAPAGYLICAGQTVDRTTYAALFTALGTTYGAGDGSTTFNLPDLRGRSVFGKDDMNGTAANRVTNAGSGVTGATLGASGGAETVTLTKSQMPSHNHQPIMLGGGNSSTSVFLNGIGSTPYSVSWFNTTFLTTEGGDQAHSNMPPAIVLNFIIKV